jgi:hypothetical protein
MGISAGASASGETTQEESVAIDKSVFFTVRVLAPEDCFLAITPSYLEVRKPAPLNFTITTTAVNGFADSIALSLQDLPAGMTAVFSKPTMAATDSSTLTLTTDGVNIYDTDFDITLRAVSI